MSDAGEFVDAALQREGSWYRADEQRERLGGELRYYGASVGAVRGTIRDTVRKYRALTHDEVTALSSELWVVPVFERRLAAIVLLQTKLELLASSDLTRIEGFIRGARLRELVDPLALDVVGPLRESLEASGRAKVDIVLDRWVRDEDLWLRRAALLSSLRALRAGGGDPAGFARRAASVLLGVEDSADSAIASEAIASVRAAAAEA